MDKHCCVLDAKTTVPYTQDALTNEQLRTALSLVHEKYVALLAEKTALNGASNSSTVMDESLFRVADLFDALQMEYWKRESGGSMDDTGDTDDLSSLFPAGDNQPLSSEHSFKPSSFALE